MGGPGHQLSGQGLALDLSYTVLAEFCTSYIFNKKKCSRWAGWAANAALCLFLGGRLSAHLQLLQSGTNILSQCSN